MSERETDGDELDQRRRNLARVRRLMPLPTKDALHGTDFYFVSEQRLRAGLLWVQQYESEYAAAALGVRPGAFKSMTRDCRSALGRQHREAHRLLLSAAPHLTADWHPAFSIFSNQAFGDAA